MSQPPRLQKSFSYSSEKDYAVESPTPSPEPGAAPHRPRYRRHYLKPHQRKRRSSVFNTVLSLFSKASPSPEPEERTDSVELDGEGSELLPEGALVESSVAQTHEEAWIQACFNAVAFVFVFITGCICLAVYYVLEPFLHPLMWAVLIGMVLHPFKYASTSQIKEWLTFLDTSGIPLSLGLLLSPAFVFNWLTQYFEYCFMSSWKMIFGLAFLTVALFLVYVLNLPLHAYNAADDLMDAFEAVNEYMAQTSYIQVCTLFIGFIILLILTVRGSDYFAPIKMLSVFLWFLLMLNLGTHLLGSVALPLIIGTFAGAFLTGILCRSYKNHGGLREEDDSKESLMENGGELREEGREKSHMLDSALRSVFSLDFDDTDDGGGKGGEGDETKRVVAQTETKEKKSTFAFLSGRKKDKDGKKDEAAKVKRSVLKKTKEKKEPNVNSSDEQQGEGDKEDEELLPESKPKVSFSSTETVTRLSSVESDLSPPDFSSPDTTENSLLLVDEQEEDEFTDGRGTRLFALSEMSAKQRAKARTQSNRVFIVLFTACFVVYIWRHPLLVLLFIPFGLWSGLKYAFSWAVTRNSKLITDVTIKWNNFKSILHSRRSVLFPYPIPTILKFYLTIDKKVLNFVKHSVGGILTTFIIVSLLILTAAVTVLLLFEIQGEVMHYVTSALAVWNRTVADTEQINQWMGVGGNETSLTALERFANQNYVYGREWLTSQVRGLIADNTSSMEHHVIELYDQFYGYFVMNNSSAFIHVSTPSTVELSGEAEFTQNLAEEKVPWAELKELVSNNLEIIISVLKSLWAILSKNMTVAFSFIYTVLEVLFSGGSALINFVVFITALFYLLSYSDEQYLPMKWVTDFLRHLSPGGGSTPNSSGGSHDQEHGSAPIENAEIFSRIIRSVFHASLRRAFFYSLYTWLIHTMFGLSVSILPSVLAGIAGAMPFVGAYWVALPAVLELWLVQGQLLTALAVMGLSLLPLFFVDTIINREIEGGHPYLTGLAIAGGIYFAGLEGAIIGPILLCCLLFFIDFYSSLFNNS